MSIAEFLRQCLKNESRSVTLGIGCSVLCAVSSVSLMAVAASFLTAMGIAALSDTFVNLFISSAAIRLFAISRTLLRYAERLTNHATTFRIITRLRCLLFSKALMLDSYHQEYLSRHSMRYCMQRDCALTEELYVKGFVPVITAFLTALAAAGFIIANLRECAFAVLISLLLCFLFPSALAYLSKGRYRISDSTEELMLSQSFDLLLKMTNLKALRVYHKVLKEFMHSSNLRCSLIMKNNLLCKITGAIQLLILQLGAIAVILTSVTPLTEGKISAPSFMMMFFIFICLSEVLLPLSEAFLIITHGGESIRRVASYLCADSFDGKDENLSLQQNLTALKTIQFLSISFSYGKRLLFKDLNLQFNADKNYLIKGPCGCGKTTVFKLITMLEKPDSGQILLNSTPSEKLSPKCVREHFSCCLQNNSMLTGTLRDIFTTARKDTSDLKIKELLDTVELNQLALSKNGLDSWIGTTGLEISGGQARRLCVARALLYQREFLLLDEPTAGLDLDMGKRLLQRILSKRKGVVVISHDSTLGDLFDEIIEIGE